MGHGEGRRREGEAAPAVGAIEEAHRETQSLAPRADLARDRAPRPPRAPRVGPTTTAKESPPSCRRGPHEYPRRRRGPEEQRAPGGENGASQDADPRRPRRRTSSASTPPSSATATESASSGSTSTARPDAAAPRRTRAQSSAESSRCLEQAAIRVPAHHEPGRRVELEEDAVGAGLEGRIDETQGLVHRPLVRSSDLRHDEAGGALADGPRPDGEGGGSHSSRRRLRGRKP